MTPLYVQQGRGLVLQYTEVEELALQQPEAFVGTAGSVIERTNAGGFRFYAHQSYDGSGKQRERYLAGPVGDPAADATAATLRARIAETKDLVPTLRMLGREGYSLVDSATYATIAVLHNKGIFAAGGMLIGSHAYGVILNRLGIKASPYTTEDIDLALREKLAFPELPDQGLLDMLRETGIDFVEVPQLDRKAPSTSFKKSGKARFHLDLLVPSADDSYPIVPVPELRAHATGLPSLKYLLAESQMGALLAREGTCAVRVPLPERFAVHKLIVSKLRSNRSVKSSKDVQQASVILAVLATTHAGAIEAAVAEVPKRAKKPFLAALDDVRPILEQAAPRAWEELSSGS